MRKRLLALVAFLLALAALAGARPVVAGVTVHVAAVILIAELAAAAAGIRYAARAVAGFRSGAAWRWP